MGDSGTEPPGARSCGRSQALLYNQHRPHTSLGGKTPAERLADLAEIIPSAETVQLAYDPDKEITRHQNTRWQWAPSTYTRVT